MKNSLVHNCDTGTLRSFQYLIQGTDLSGIVLLYLPGVLNFNFKFTAVTTNTHPQRVFSLVQTCVLVDVNQLLPWFFTHLPRVDSLSISGALRRICRHFSQFRNILLQDLTLLYVKTMRSINLLSVFWRKLKLLTYLHTVSYNHLSFLNTCSQLV